jgi:hypothetical protein
MINELLKLVLNDKSIYKLIKFVANNKTIKLTRIGKPSRNYNSFKLTIGTPNYAEKKLIKTYLKAGVYFPVLKPYIKRYKS